jgi:rhodanese-related sulfurtransferase
MKNRLTFMCAVVALVFGSYAPISGQLTPKPVLDDAIVRESSPGPAPQVSTTELKAMLATGGAVLLDARPPEEYGMSHIPGALNVAPKPGVPISVYVSDVEEVRRLVNYDSTKLLVLYCNGPFCGKSKRLSIELAAAGFTNVWRYQLGMPGWRTTGGVAVIEIEQMLQVSDLDGTAWFVDAGLARPREQGFSSRILSGEVTAAKDDGRLPVLDHNTRIIVVGATAAQAKTVAQEITANAFHNVSYYDGSGDDLQPFSKNEK